MHLRQVPALLAACAAIASCNDSWAWGATGHEWVSGIAIEKLPDSVPEFIRTPEAGAEIAVMGRELDRSKVRLPAPVQPKPGSVPMDDRVGLDNGAGAQHRWKQPIEQNKEQSVGD
jgi:hypothetical protein